MQLGFICLLYGVKYTAKSVKRLYSYRPTRKEVQTVFYSRCIIIIIISLRAVVLCAFLVLFNIVLLFRTSK